MCRQPFFLLNHISIVILNQNIKNQKSEIRDYRKLKEIGIKTPAMLEADVKNEHILKDFIDGDTICQLILEAKMKADYIEQLLLIEKTGKNTQSIRK